MKRTVCFVHRKSADTPSIERVFAVLEPEFKKASVEVVNIRLPFGNGVFGMFANLLLFRPPKADIYHVTGHVHYIALRLPAAQTLLTVHDLGILRNRRGLRRQLIKKLYFDWPFRKLKLITAISGATKDDILASTTCRPEKIKVIYDPLEPAMLSYSALDFNSEAPTVLQVGTAPHKNLESVIDAVRGTACKLLIVGKPNRALIDRLNESGVDHELTVAEDDEQMRAIYDRSDVLTFCSTFEGFGLPIIEAQARGLSVITSNRPPMNEVAGNGAVLVDPNSTEEIRVALNKLSADDSFRETLVKSGKQNIERYDATKIAGEYLELYEQL